MKSIFEKDLSGEMVSPNEPGYDALIDDIFATIKIATEMNTGYRTPKRYTNIWARFSVNRLKKVQRCCRHSTSTTVSLSLSERVLHPAMLHFLRSRRHNDWR